MKVISPLTHILLSSLPVVSHPTQLSPRCLIFSPRSLASTLCPPRCLTAYSASLPVVSHPAELSFPESLITLSCLSVVSQRFQLPPTKIFIMRIVVSKSVTLNFSFAGRFLTEFTTAFTTSTERGSTVLGSWLCLRREQRVRFSEICANIDTASILCEPWMHLGMFITSFIINKQYMLPHKSQQYEWRNDSALENLYLSYLILYPPEIMYPIFSSYTDTSTVGEDFD